MRLALITSQTHRGDALAVDAPLIAALKARDIDVAFPAWDDDSLDWGMFAAAVVRTTWDYQHTRDRFVDVLDTIAVSTQLINPAPLIRWNTHKNYLVDLEDQGVPVIQTVVVPRASNITLDVLAATHNFHQVVIKPAVGAGGRDVIHGSVTAPSLAQQFDVMNQHEDVIVQPYLETVTSHGETSLIVCGGEVTHAVVKTPADGDFRAHERYGARYLAVAPNHNQNALARWVVTTLHPHTPILARIDLLTDRNGTLYVSEVELTEPNLYLTVVPDAAHAVAEALIKAVNTRSNP
ncbi:MAG: hypothetical protein WD360_01870 [Nitriliruptoraceae bacterium]